MKPKKLTILFDASPIFDTKKSGIGYYTYQLISSLNQYHNQDIRLVGHYFNFLGKRESLDIKVVKLVESKFFHPKINSLLRKVGVQLPLELFYKHRGDVALFTNFVSLPSLTKVPTCVAVHDLCFEEKPQYVSDKNQKFLSKFVPRSIKRAEKVITISESTKNAIKKHYSLDDNKIFITPIPPSKPMRKNKTYLKKFNINEKYILFVSTLEPRKNFINLVKAYELLPKNVKEEYILVLCGSKGWKSDQDFTYIDKSIKSGNQIIVTNYVTDDERAALYSNASLFVLPSHYEGFGMPILEAMSYGIPTICSDIEVFHEVAGKAALYFDKDNPADLADKIQKVFSDKDLYKNLQKAGNEKQAEYSWEKVAETVYKEMVEIVEKKDRE